MKARKMIGSIYDGLCDFLSLDSDLLVQSRSSWYAMLWSSMTAVLWTSFVHQLNNLWILPIRIVLEPIGILAMVFLSVVVYAAVSLYMARKRRLLTSDQLFWRLLLWLGNAALTMFACAGLSLTGTSEAYLCFGQLSVSVKHVMSIVHYIFVLGETVLWLVCSSIAYKKNRSR